MFWTEKPRFHTEHNAVIINLVCISEKNDEENRGQPNTSTFLR